MLNSNLPTIDETRPLFSVASLSSPSKFEDCMSRNIDIASKFDLEQYKKTQRIHKIVAFAALVIAIIIVLVCIL